MAKLEVSLLLVFQGSTLESAPPKILHNVSLLEEIVFMEVLLEFEDNFKPNDPHYTYNTWLLEVVVLMGMMKIVLG